MKYLLSTALFAAWTMQASAGTVLINEFRPNPTGTDPDQQTLELIGTAGDMFDGFFVSIDTDANRDGEVNSIERLSGVFDPNGLLTLIVEDIENPSNVLALVGLDTTLAVGEDTNVDGDASTFDDVASFGTVFDAISISDQTADVNTLASQLGGTDFAFTGDEPQLIFRDSQTLELFAINEPAGSEARGADGSRVEFSIFDTDPRVATFGAINPTAISAVPLPAGGLLLLSAVGAGFAVNRRRRH